MAGDPYFENVSLLMHMDGSNGSTTFTDSSNNNFTVTPAGTAQISTAQSKFGGASGLFDGNSDYLTIPDNNAWDFPGDFTIETFVYFNAYSASFGGAYGAAIVANYRNDAGDDGWQLRVNGTDSSYNIVNVYSGSTNIDFAIGSSLALNTWHHIAVSRSGSSLRAFVNGVQVDSTVTNSDIFTKEVSQPLYIGRLNDPTFLFYLNGYLDDLRITKDIARYTANFTPPTAAFLNYAGQVNGTLSEPLAATDFKAHAHDLSGNLLSASTVTAGAYSIDFTTLDTITLTMYPDIGTKWTASTAYALNDKVFPTDPATTPYYYECTTAGTTGATEPTWPTSAGTVNDGTVAWTLVEQMVQPITQGPLIPT